MSIKLPEEELELEDDELEEDEEELELLDEELLLDELLEPGGSDCPPQLARASANASVAHLKPARGR